MQAPLGAGLATVPGTARDNCMPYACNVHWQAPAGRRAQARACLAALMAGRLGGWLAGWLERPRTRGKQGRPREGAKVVVGTM